LNEQWEMKNQQPWRHKRHQQHHHQKRQHPTSNPGDTSDISSIIIQKRQSTSSKPRSTKIKNDKQSLTILVEATWLVPIVVGTRTPSDVGF